MERESGLDGIKIWDLLTSLLVVFGGGARGSVVTRMTIQEFLAVKKADNGKWQVMVADHKTKQDGPAPLTFLYQGLYEVGGGDQTEKYTPLH